MSTVEELDAEIAAKIISDTQQTQRMIDDYFPGSGEQIPLGEFRFRLKVDVLDRESIQSNIKGNICNVEIEWKLMMELTGVDIQPRVYTAAATVDQQTLVNADNDGFWKTLDSVHDIAPGVLPLVTSGLERVGQVLKFTVTAQVVLQF